MNSLEETFDSPEAAALLRVRRERDEARAVLQRIEYGYDYGHRLTSDDMRRIAADALKEANS